MGLRLQAAFSRSLEGRALVAAGERAQAIAVLREAEQELDACGSVRVRDEMRRELRKLGARAEPRGPATAGDSGIEALTKRELEIAGLVTDRLTNREIATALFLSDKTVESHVRNIFHKLGVSSRVDVARAVERERRRARSRRRRDAVRAAARSRMPRGLHELGYPPGALPRAPRLGQRRPWLRGHLAGRRALRRRARRHAVAGPAWVWVLPVALAGQCLLLAVYAELASEFPVAGGAYQWTRRLLGPTYGWLSGWVAVCAYCAANTTVAYLGAPWALTLARDHADAQPDRGDGDGPRRASARSSARSASTLLRRAIKAGIAAEIVASVGIGLALLLVFRTQDVSILTRHAWRRGALRGLGRRRACSLRSPSPAGCSSASTRASAPPRRREAPRATSPCDLDRTAERRRARILNAFASTLAHPDPAGVVAGQDIDPVTTSVVSVVRLLVGEAVRGGRAVAFLACGTAAQALTARTIFSIARDDVLPGSRFLRRVDRRQAPLGAIVVDHGCRLCRPAARPRLGGRRQPDRLRHGGDLRRLPPRRRSPR